MYVECGHDQKIERDKAGQWKEEVEIEPPKCTEDTVQESDHYLKSKGHGLVRGLVSN